MRKDKDTEAALSLMKMAMALFDKAEEHGMAVVHLQEAIDLAEGKSAQQQCAEAATLEARLFGKPIRIIDAVNGGLVLGNDAERWSEPWSDVQQVAAARVPLGTSTIFIALITITGTEGERTVMASEADCNWDEILRALSRGLVGIESFDVWSRRPEIGSRAVVIYDQRGGR